MRRIMEELTESIVTIPADKARLEGNLVIPTGAKAIVLFAHGSGSSRHSIRNRYVAGALNEGDLATLLFDLLSTEEETIDIETTHLRFDIALLAERLISTIEWVSKNETTRGLKIGLFGSSTGAAAALVAAAQCPEQVFAVVSRGGRPDLASSSLPSVKTPTLFIVGGNDVPVLSLNRQAAAELRCENHLEVIPHATHLFEEPNALEEVARLAREWFLKKLISEEL